MAKTKNEEVYSAKVIEGIARIWAVGKPSQESWEDRIRCILNAAGNTQILAVESVLLDIQKEKSAKSLFTDRYVEWIIKNTKRALSIAFKDPKVLDLLLEKSNITYAKEMLVKGTRIVGLPYSAFERYGKSGLEKIAASLGKKAVVQVLYDTHEPQIINDTLNHLDNLGENGYFVPEMPTVIWKVA